MNIDPHLLCLVFYKNIDKNKKQTNKKTPKKLKHLRFGYLVDISILRKFVLENTKQANHLVSRACVTTSIRNSKKWMDKHQIIRWYW